MTNTAISINSRSNPQGNQQLTMALLQIIGGSLFIAILAQVKIPLFFSPVPFTFQTFAIMLVAGCLGRLKGTSAVLAYLTQLGIGLPVAAGGAISPLALIGPTGGYVLGFVVLAYLAGWCSDHQHKMGRFPFLLSLFSISLLQLSIGTMWLATFTGFKNAFFMGFLPFVVGELLKSIAASSCISHWRCS